VPAIVVLVYYKLSRRTTSGFRKVLLICSGGLLWSLLVLSNTLHLDKGGSKSEAVQRLVSTVSNIGRKTKTPVLRDKWDGVLFHVLSDVVVSQEQYVSDVSQSETGAPKFLAPESFRDAATMQEELSCIQARLAINEKYASSDPFTEKMKGYVQAVDASEGEKRQFLERFETHGQQIFVVRAAVSDLERNWLQSSTEVYKFALRHQKDYSLQDRNLVFHSATMQQAFNNEIDTARRQYSEFLLSHRQFRQFLDGALAQVGMQRSDLVPTKSK
jgi:hypothetical protein